MTEEPGLIHNRAAMTQYMVKQRKIRIVPIIVWAIIIGVAAHFANKVSFSDANGIISPLPNSTSSPSTLQILFDGKARSQNELVTKIKALTEKKQGFYSVYIFDLTNNTGIGINETTILTAASVNKLPILAALYYENESGTLDLDRRITLQAKDIQDFGTGVLRYQGPGGLYSLKTLAQLLIEKSDNTAAYVLTQIVGESRIQELVEKWGMSQTDIKNNKTSNKDIALLLTKMYKEQIVGHALTTEMIGFMDDSDFENRLPKLLPETVDVYHKIGNEVGYIHDVGIITLRDRPYYLGVMTNDILDVEDTEQTIAEISKYVYDYMNSR